MIDSMLGINRLYVELTHVSIAVIDLIERRSRAIAFEQRTTDNSDDVGGLARVQDFEFEGEGYLDRMAVDTLFLTSSPNSAVAPPQHACTAQLCSVSAARCGTPASASLPRVPALASSSPCAPPHVHSCAAALPSGARARAL